MKKIVLAVIMVVMLSTPCFAQEIKPNYFFWIENTLWQFMWGTDDEYLGFARKKVFFCKGSDCEMLSNSSYEEYMLYSTFHAVLPAEFDYAFLEGYLVSYLRLGRGFSPETDRVRLVKVADFWFPPDNMFPCIPIDDIEFTPPDELDPGDSTIDSIIIDPYPDDIFDDPMVIP